MGVELAEDAVAVGRRDQIVIVIWRGEPTNERLQRSYEAVVRAIDRAGGPVAFVKIIEPGSPAPSAAQLPWVARELDDLRERVAAVGVVLEERDAETGALVDAAATIHSLTTPQRQPLKIFSDADEAMVWMMRRLELTPTPAWRRETLAWIEALRDAMPASSR